MSEITAQPRQKHFPRLSENVMPFSKVRNNLADCIKRTRATHMPIIITQNGCATSILADVKDFEDFMEAQKLREDVRIAEAEADAGLGIPHDQAVREMEALFKTFPEKP